MIVVDSSVWIDFFNDTSNPACDALGDLLSEGKFEIGVPDLLLYEVLRGFRSEQDLREARRLMGAFELLPSGGEAVSLAAVDHYRALRAGGWTVRSGIDVLIATICIQGDHHLLHNDRDYDAFEARRGLQVWKIAASPP